MNKRTGFTLMELLLVVAILAVIAAVAAPQFFRTATESVDASRMALLKANYQAIKSAINMQVWDEINKNLPAAKRLNSVGFAATDALGRIKVMVENGYLQESATTWENKTGLKRFLYVDLRGTTTLGAPSGVASTPTFMDQVPLFRVIVVLPETAAGYPVAGYGSIDDALKAGLTWDQIWAALKDV